MGRKSLAFVVPFSCIVVLVGAGLAGAADGTIDGVVFTDANGDGRRQASEAPIEGHRLSVRRAADGALVGAAMSDAAGSFAFTGVSDGTYVAEYDPMTWLAIRDSLAPTTTGSLEPLITFEVRRGSGSVAFGWRAVERSTDLSAPISTYTGSSGLRAESFVDVVAARDVHDRVLAGTLIGDEAATVVVRVGYEGLNFTATEVSGGPGSYSNYRAISYVSYGRWLDGDAMLFHEYGHAWSFFHASITQQTGTFDSYLRARGIEGDPRVGSSIAWAPNEMIAEDYRQLFGTPDARALPQENRDLPPAAEVDGLRAFLAGTFTEPVAPAPDPEPDPAPEPEPDPAPALQILDVTVTEQVTKQADVSVVLTSPAELIVVVLDANGSLVATLLDGVIDGEAAVTWDRIDHRGRRAKAGSYLVEVRASDGATDVVARAPFEIVNGKR